MKSRGSHPQAKVDIYKNEEPVSWFSLCLAVLFFFHCLMCFSLCLSRHGGAEPSAYIDLQNEMSITFGIRISVRKPAIEAT